MNKRSNKFSPEVRERATQLVQEHRGEYSSLSAAVESIAPKISCVPHTLLGWGTRQRVDRQLKRWLSGHAKEQRTHGLAAV